MDRLKGANVLPPSDSAASAPGRLLRTGGEHAEPSPPDQPGERWRAGAAPAPDPLPRHGARPRVPSRPPPPHFRPDVEGLRAVAVILVMLYHAGLPFLPGGFVGVDVFFVISGYLITGLLVREAEQTGTISLGRFYARRVKRLLPAATLVLVVTALLSWWLAPVTERRAFGGDIASAALYVVNWRLADRSVDYLAEDVGASPVQHYWSLAVEEQFYLVWPLIFLLVAWWVRRAREPVRPWLAVALTAVVVPSFIWSVVASLDGGATAFFTTTTRLWELGVGAALAIGTPALRRMPQAVGALLAWAGLLAILLAALLVESGAAWPGYLAALPVLGAAAVIAGGLVAIRGAAGLLGARPMVWLGGLSYSLYLWHWPVLVFATMWWGELSPSAGLLAVTLSIVPAWLAYRLIENPMRHSRAMVRSSGFTLSVGANLSLAAVVAGGALVLSVGATAVAPPGGDRTPAGAAVLGDVPRDDPDGVPVDEVEWMFPDPLAATEDVPDAYQDGCQLNADATEVRVCEYGAADSDLTIALVGDSKALQWVTALDAIGDAQGWRVVTYTKSACAYADVMQVYEGEPYEECDVWRREVDDQLAADPPDYVITSQSRSTALSDRDDPDSDRTEAAMLRGLENSWERLSDAGIGVIALADNPHPSEDVYECVAANPDRLTACAFDRAEGLRASATATLRRAVEESGDADLIDLNDVICPADRCAPVIGNALIYRQGSHLTMTYVNSLAPRLEAALLEIVE